MLHSQSKPYVVRHEVIQPYSEPYRLIPLTQGQNAIVDAQDFEWLSQWNWYAQWFSCTRSFYAARRQNHKKIYMHLAILECKGGEKGDHRNRDSLDNRRQNLRKCTQTQNTHNQRLSRRNTSGYKGVSWHTQRNKWSSNIRVNRKAVHLGTFYSREDAARAYDAAAIKYFGEFACPNFASSSEGEKPCRNQNIMN
jgi:hypothetical protein